MLLLLRKVLFFLLLGLYLVLMPYFLLYGLGYKFNPSERELMKTGLISVATEPRGATVYLEGKKFAGKTPAVIRGLRPGRYQVRLTKKGFETWSKDIEILPEKASRLEPVVLLAQNPEKEVIVWGPFHDILPRATDFKMYVLRKPVMSGLEKIDLLFKNAASLEKENPEANKTEILESRFKTDSTAAFFKVKRQGKTHFILYDLDREKVLKDLTAWLPEKTDHVDWDLKTPSHFIFLKDGVIQSIDLNKETLHLIGRDYLGFGVRGSKLYAFKKDFSVWHSDLKGGDSTLAMGTDNPLTSYFTKLDSDFYRLEVLKRDLFQKEILIFISKDGAMLTPVSPFLLSEKDVKDILLTEGAAQKLLYWTGSEMGMYDFELSGDMETFPPKTVLYRSGSDIDQAFWAYDDTHVLFLDENEIFLLEAADQAPYHIRHLGAASKKSKIVYLERQRALFYLDAKERNLTKWKISEP